MAQQGTPDGQDQDIQSSKIIENVKKDIKDIVTPAKLTEIFKDAIKHDDMKNALDAYIDAKLKNNWSAVLLKSLGNIKSAVYAIFLLFAGGFISHFVFTPKPTPTQQQSKVEAQQVK
jgi:hypothetical protein